MGIANWRRKNDPNFGKPAANSAKIEVGVTERGIVVSNPVVLEGESIFLKSSNLDPEELRFSLLYWDKLVWPQNGIYQGGGNGDSSFLESAGILSRPNPKPKSGNATELAFHSHTSVFEELNMIQPGQWALSWSDQSMSAHPAFEKFTEQRSTLLELHRAIPIPDVDIPLAEILEFKVRRRDEFLLLRTHFEKLASDIDASDEPNDLLNTRIKEVDDACANLVQLGREWRWPMRLGSLNASVSFEPMKAISAGVTALTIAGKTGLNLPSTAAMVGAAGLLSTISWKPSDFGFQSIRQPKNPYRYAYSIDAELR